MVHLQLVRLQLAIIFSSFCFCCTGQIIQTADIGKHVGKEITVYGSIYDGKYLSTLSARPTFLDFEGKFPNQAASVFIADSNRNNFKYLPEEYLKYRSVWVTGKVTKFNDQYRIEVVHADQVKVDSTAPMLTVLSTRSTTNAIDTIYSRVDVEAHFSGGIDEWGRHMKRKFPRNIVANEELQPGSYSITVQFVVRSDSSISNVEAVAVSGNCRPCLMDAISALKFSPKWVPALFNNRPVSSRRSLVVYRKVVAEPANSSRFLDQLILPPGGRPN